MGLYPNSSSAARVIGIRKMQRLNVLKKIYANRQSMIGF